MALTTTTVTGIIDLPNGATPVAARVIFELTGWAKEGENIFVSGPVEVAVEPDGSFSVSLQTTEDLPVNYHVAVGYRVPSLGKDIITKLGVISVPDLPSPVALAELLSLPAPVPSIPDALQQALAAAARAEMAAASVQPVLDDRLAAEGAAVAAGISAGLAQGAANTAAQDAAAAANALISPNVAAAEDAKEAAEIAADKAESARDAAFINANVYPDVATGRAAVADGGQFQVVNGDEIIRYRRDSGSAQTEVARYPSASSLPSPAKPASPLPIMDAIGYAADVVFGGYKSSFGLSDCDAIVLWGDSHTEGGPSLPSKAWPCVLGSLTPYRVRNRGISGWRTSHVYDRLQSGQKEIVTGVSWEYNDLNSFSPSQFHIIILAENESSLAAYRQNLRHVVELLLARGARVAIMTQPGRNATIGPRQHQLALSLCREFGLDFIEGQSRRPELQITAGPFSDGGHVSTRTGTIYWSIIAEWLRRAPRPRRSIKIYSARNPSAVLSDLVYAQGGDDYDIARRWKELDCQHTGIGQTQWYDEYIGHVGQHGGGMRRDQYERLHSPIGLTLGHFVMVRAMVPVTASMLEGAAIEVGSDATNAYILDRTANNVVDTDATPGVWREVPYVNGMVRLSRQDLLLSMHENELAVALYKYGGVTIGRPRVHYSATMEAAPVRALRLFNRRSTIRAVATKARADFTVVGTPAEVVPFDLMYGAPRQPGSTSAITGVLEVTNSNTFGGNEALAAGQTGTYRITVWARYWPKPFLDPTLYPAATIPADQIINRTDAGVTFEGDSPIRSDTCDLRRLRLTAEVTTNSAAPNTNMRQDATVGVYWMPVEFIVDAPPGALPGYLNWQLSAPEDTIQIGKVIIEEVEAYATRN